MSNAKGGNVFEEKIMPKVYGIGAAVVIVGALFKIMHWPLADIMLIAGLGTEALIFLASAFQKPHKDPDWAKVYPQLAEDFEYKADGGSVTKKLDDMLREANVSSDSISSLGAGLNRLSETTSQM